MCMSKQTVLRATGSRHGQRGHGGFFLAAFALLGFLFILEAHGEPLRIGVSVPLTGDLAEYGVAVQRGFELAAAEAGGKTLEWSYEDNKYDGAQGILAYRRLRDSHKADLLFSWGEAPLHAIAPIAEREGMPTIAMSVDTVPVEGKKWTVLSVNPPSDFISTLYASLKEKSFSRMGFVVSDDPFTRGMYEEFLKAVRPPVATTLVATVTPGERDFKSIALKLARADFDAVGVFLLSGQVSQIYKELGRTKFSAQTFGTDVFESPTEIKAAGARMQGALYANIRVPKEFEARYLARYASNSQIAFAYNAYVVGRWLATDFRAFSAGADPATLLSAVLRGPQGEPIGIRRSEKGFSYLRFPIAVKKVVGGGFEEVG
jgi:branched-chain amino acid transport system substrate-binding protein